MKAACIIIFLFETFCEAELFSQQLTKYVDPGNFFEISYPNEWQAKPNYKTAKFATYQPNKTDPSSHDAIVAVSTTPKTEVKSLKELKSNVRVNILLMKKSKILKFEDKPDHEYPGFYAEYTFFNHGSQYREGTWWVLKGDFYYNVFYRSKVDCDSIFLTSGLASVNSFTVSTENITGDFGSNEARVELKPIPNPQAKTLILKRWEMVDVVGERHERFAKRKERGEGQDFEFASDGTMYLYEGGILKESFSYLVAPDGSSLILRNTNSKNAGSIQIISIDSNELKIKFKQIYDDDVIIMHPR